MKTVLILKLMLCSYICFSQSKSTFSKKLSQEIEIYCRVCNSQKQSIRKKSYNQFHLAHELFENGKIDSSFIVSSKLIENKDFTEKELLYVLYIIKGRTLNDKLLLDDAIENFNLAITYGKKIESLYLSNIYALLGRIHLEKEDYTKCIDVLNYWLSNYENDNLENKRVVYHNIGLAYLHLEAFKKAEENLKISFSLNHKFNDTLGLARSSLDIANLHYVQYQDKLALEYFEKGLDYALKGNDLITLKNAYFNLSIVEESNKNYLKSLNYRKSYETIVDSIWNKDKVWALAKKEKEIFATVQEEKTKTEKLKKEFFRRTSTIAVIIIFSIAFLYFKLNKQKNIIAKQKKKLSELNITKDKLFSILTHDLKTPIYSLNKNLLKLRLSTTTNLENKPEFLSLINKSIKISKNTSLQIENTLHWILNNKNELVFNMGKIHLDSILNQIILDFEPILETKNIKLTKNISSDLFIYSDLNSTKIIFRNIIDNAIKFSHQNGNIIINCNNHDKFNEIEFIDYGVGLKKEMNTKTELTNPISTKLGLKLSKDLIFKNRGKLKLYNGKEKGTVASVFLLKNYFL